MKNALEMVREVQEYERKKAEEKARVSQDILEARNGYIKLSLWEKLITMPRFKKLLAKETHIYKSDGIYKVYNTLGSRYGYSRKWINYGAHLMEQQGYLEVKVYSDICGRPEITATCPRSTAEQVLFSKKGS